MCQDSPLFRSAEKQETMTYKNGTSTLFPPLLSYPFSYFRQEKVDVLYVYFSRWTCVRWRRVIGGLVGREVCPEVVCHDKIVY